MSTSTKQPNVPAWLVAILIAFGAIGGGVVASNQPAPAPTPVTTTTTTTVPIVQPVAVRRYFSDKASWNQPASTFGPSKTLQSYAQRWWDHGGGTDKKGSVNVAFGDYSIPDYSASEKTTDVTVFQTTWSQKLYTFPIATMPWNPKWKPGTGNDNLLSVVDEKTGTAWVVGGIGQLRINCFDWFGPNGQAGYDINNPNHLCTTGVQRHEGLYTISDGTTNDGRGMGINKLALTVRADEVRSGAIRHALAMTITNTMFGQPACAPVNSAAAPGFGVSCGGYVKPATKLERAVPNDINCQTPTPITDAERSKTIPEGMRFALRITDAEITTWLDGRKYTGQLRETARIFAVALRDYGWIIAETGCFGMHIETDSAVAGNAAPVWKQLGITGSSGPPSYPNGDLLFGLITPERVYVVEPPS